MCYVYFHLLKKSIRYLFQGFLLTDYEMYVDSFMALAWKPLHYLWTHEKATPQCHLKHSSCQYLPQAFQVHPTFWHYEGSLAKLSSWICVFVFLKSKSWDKNMLFPFLFFLRWNSKIYNLPRKDLAGEVSFYFCRLCVSLSPNDRNSKKSFLQAQWLGWRRYPSG